MKIGSFKHVLLATALLASPATTLPVWAQASQTKVYDIPSQPLGDALTQLAQESGRDILFDAAAVNSRKSIAVHGVHDFEVALRALLSGAELSYSIRADGSVTIRPGKHTTARDSGGASDRGEAVDRELAATETVTIQANADRAETLELKSNTDVSVVSAEDIASHADRNVAETLSRIPGINVMYSTLSQVGSSGNGANYGGLDTAARAEGQFVSVRAMNGEYNVNLINGIDVAQGMPYSREVELSLLPPVGIDDIVVSKTSTADMQGDAIGGTIDFRMPSAFKNPGAHFSVYAS